MNYNELVAYYQVNLLGEKDYRGFDPDRKLGNDQGSMNITAKKDQNVYRPYNQSSQVLSTLADQQMKKIDASVPGTILPIADNIARELASFYNVSIAPGGDSKRLNSVTSVSIGHNGKSYVLTKN